MDHDILTEELDDLISDIHGLIDEEQPQAEPEEPAEFVLPEAPEEPPVEEGLQTQRWTDRQKVPKHVAKLQQNQEEAYAKWLQEQAEKAPELPPELAEEEENGQTPAKKKKSTALWLCGFVVLLTLAVVLAACWIVPRQPKAQVAGIRVSRSSTILLAGTDDTYARTDMLMLLNLNGKNKTASMVSIPRDALVSDGTQTVELGDVYGLRGGGSEGVAALKEAAAQCVGFLPDGCVVLHPETLTAFLDVLGGITFDVPRQMELGGVTLQEGVQTLNGEQALALMRWCGDGDDPDLQRMQTQRQFLARVMEVCTTGGLLKAPGLLDVMTAGTVTDLSSGNFLWLAKTAMGVDLDNVYTATLPGSYEDGYILDPELVAQTVNAGCNPYVRAVSTEDLAPQPQA